MTAPLRGHSRCARRRKRSVQCDAEGASELRDQRPFLHREL